MNGRVEIQPSGKIVATVRPPGSKSITNRALVCAALATGDCELRGILQSEDTEVMLKALGQLGYSLDQTGDTVVFAGGGGLPTVADADVYVANSGTTIRFLTAMLAAGEGNYRLDGVPRMRQRPIGDLAEALNQLGADVSATNGCPPVQVRARGLEGGAATVAGNISSQFLSGLLMACPYAGRDVELAVEGELVSKPYVTMTLEVMRAFGGKVEAEGMQRFQVAAGHPYQGRIYEIEPDASAASYFWAAAAITGGKVAVRGLSSNALQGDVHFCDCLASMGCGVEYREDAITVSGGTLRGIEVNMNAISDTVQTLAAVALFAEGPTTITVVGHIRFKETDRIGDLARELRKTGAEVDEFEDGLRITPKPLTAVDFETYDDHRMAMSLALVGLRVPGIGILDPGCCRKTYPAFFEDLAEITTPCA